MPTRFPRGGALEIDAETDDILQSYAWPGNIRQLEHVINRAYILADSGRITLADLPPEISRPDTALGSPGFIAEKGSLRERLRHAEAGLIAKALDDAGGDRKLAAHRLGIGLSSLYRKLEELADLGLVRGG